MCPLDWPSGPCFCVSSRLCGGCRLLELYPGTADTASYPATFRFLDEWPPLGLQVVDLLPEEIDTPDARLRTSVTAVESCSASIHRHQHDAPSCSAVPSSSSGTDLDCPDLLSDSDFGFFDEEFPPSPLLDLDRFFTTSVLESVAPFTDFLNGDDRAGRVPLCPPPPSTDEPQPVFVV